MTTPIQLPGGPVHQDEPLHWWQNPKWIASVAFLIFSFAFLTVAVTSYQLNRKQDSRAKTLDNIDNVVTRLDRNQVGIDELVAFVHEVEASQAKTQGGTSKAAGDIITLLCTSSDEVRLAACAQLGYQPLPQG